MWFADDCDTATSIGHVRSRSAASPGAADPYPTMALSDVAGRWREQLGCRTVFEVVDCSAPTTGALLPHWGVERRAQHVAGRRAAAKALSAELGCAPMVERGPHGEPVWPPGILGSISHTETLAVAVVSRQGHACSVGVDVEDAALGRRNLPMNVFTREERVALSAPVETMGQAPDARLLLSAKESVYKCAYQLDGSVLAFQDVSVWITGGETFVVRAERPKAESMASILFGYFVRLPTHWLTLCIARVHGAPAVRDP